MKGLEEHCIFLITSVYIILFQNKKVYCIGLPELFFSGYFQDFFLVFSFQHFSYISGNAFY